MKIPEKRKTVYFNFAKKNKIRTLIAPSISEADEHGNFHQWVRPIKIEDLLGRPEISINIQEVAAEFRDKIIMVTGAAGSIGSELCRQLAQMGIRKLIMFDSAETPLHNVRLEFEKKYSNLDFVPIIGDVRVKERLRMVFETYQPQIIFHAAAYKHVPLMEENPCEAVLVNVVGSRQVADMAVEYGAEKMIMVSTDKAVNPTNVMGCSKRLAEIYVQSLGCAIREGKVKGRTKFITTRFGNVLGSNGSVIPRFKEQIENGGPVTVTHPDIIRFFMTIPEACRLVMEAATMSEGNEIFVFEMGTAVKIVDLATRMIDARVHGLQVLGLIVNGWDEKTAGSLEKSNLYYYEKLTGLPILGKLPVLSQELLQEFDSRALAEITEANIDIDKILSLAGGVVK